VVLRVDSYEPGGKLRKTLRADAARIEQVGKLQLALAFELEDVVGGTKTRVALEQVRFDTDLPDRKFRPTDLSSGSE
jgi:outer membrane lipoprotein-sorting protein